MPKKAGILQYIISKVKLEFLGLFQENLIFKPRSKRIEPMRAPEIYGLYDVEPLELTTEDNIKLHVWYKKPQNNKPLFIFFHGNTGHLGDVGAPLPDENYDRRYRIKVIGEIEKTGAGYIAVSLRGYGLSHKTKSGEDGFIKDTRAVIDYALNKILIPHDRIIIIGESLGAAIAMIAAEQMAILGMPPAIVTSIAAFSSMKWKVMELHPDLSAEGVEKRLRHKFDSEVRIKKLAKETYLLIAHPGEDEVTLKNHSQKLYKIAQESGLKVKYKEFEGAGHITWNPAEVVAEIMTIYESLKSNK